MPLNSPSPIFLVGCPRSGTTFLQSLIAAHPQIASFPETKFFNNLTPDPGIKQQLGLVARNRIHSTLCSFFASINQPELIVTLPKLPFKAIYIPYFIHLLNQLTRDQGKKRFLEKTPQHLYHIEEIQRYLPNAQFIHLYRNGTDVVASLYEVTHRYPKIWGGSWDLDRCINTWIEMIQLSSQYLDQPNHCAVRYEKMIVQTSDQLQKLCQFLHLEYSETMIEDYANQSQFLVNKTSRKVEPQIRDIHDVSKKFYTLFTPEQQNYIVQQLSATNLEEISFL